MLDATAGAAAAVGAGRAAEGATKDAAAGSGAAEVGGNLEFVDIQAASTILLPSPADAQVGSISVLAHRNRRPLDDSLPAVSIIVPAHNAAWCLGEALASILAQSYNGPLEVFPTAYPLYA
jgi:hypothetical protein